MSFQNIITFWKCAHHKQTEQQLHIFMLCKIISRAALNPFAGRMHNIRKNHLAGRIKSVRRPHAAREPYVWHPCSILKRIFLIMVSYAWHFPTFLTLMHNGWDWEIWSLSRPKTLLYWVSHWAILNSHLKQIYLQPFDFRKRLTMSPNTGYFWSCCKGPSFMLITFSF